MKQINVIKRGGSKEPFNPEKLHEAVMFACEGLTGVSVSEIEINANIQLMNNIKTSDIQDIVIKSAHDLISEENPNYQYAAARLLNQKIRKEVYKQYEPLPFLDEVKKRVKNGFYDSEIFDYYTDEEIEYFGKKIRYQKDEKFTYAGLSQLYTAYLIKDKNKKPIETPQEIFMLIQMYAFRKYPKDKRKQLIIDGYKIHSDGEISFPTPIMVGMRGRFRRFISCNLINTGDSAVSLSRAADAVMRLTASRSGLGVGAGWIRGLGAPIDSGRIFHTGIVPILQVYEKGTLAFTQGSRGGSSTMYYPFFHTEIEDIIVLKNNKGTEENRVRQADHCIQFNRLFFKRLKNNEEITLFYMNSVPGLYTCMGEPEKFEKLYTYYERTIPKKDQKRVKASEIWDLFINEVYQTGRIYWMDMDNSVSHSSFIQDRAPITMSNLCLAGDTIVETDKGPSLLKDIKRGDKVKTFNINTGAVEFKPVTKWLRTSPSADVMKITHIPSGKFIECTADHQIWTHNRGYVEARNLCETDILEVDNEYTHTPSIKIEYTNKRIPVYDISVKDNHNFYANDILVHNCTEITTPALPLDENYKISFYDGEKVSWKKFEPEIGVCILASFNLGQVKNIDRIPVIADYLVRFLEEVIDYQEYAMPEVEYAAKKRRTLGIGISDVFHLLAKNKIFYNTKEGRNFLHKWMEKISYYLIKTSIELAQERGPCELYEDTKYSQGLLPIDTYKRTVDELTDEPYHEDWDSLREKLKKYGIRHSTLIAIAPTASSSMVANNTPGIDPPRKLLNIKEDKNQVVKQLVPDFHRYKNYYTTAWEIDNIQYIKFVAVAQKFTDQAISTNRYVDYSKWSDNKYPKSLVNSEYAAAQKYGLKTLYYVNFRTDNSDDIEKDDGTCSGGGCKI